MSGQEDAGRDAVALVQAALDGDSEAAGLLLDNCDQRETCAALAALAAWLVSRFGEDNAPVLMGALRKAALGEAVRLVSDGLTLSEQAGV